MALSGPTDWILRYIKTTFTFLPICNVLNNLMSGKRKTRSDAWRRWTIHQVSRKGTKKRNNYQLPQDLQQDNVELNNFLKEKVAKMYNRIGKPWTLKILNSSVDINWRFYHKGAARRWRTGRVYSHVHTGGRTQRVPFASTANTSRCGLSVPDEPDAVCTWATGRVPVSNGTRIG